LAAARAAATAALALAIAAMASVEGGVAPAGLVVSSTFFLHAGEEASTTNAHITSEQRNRICIFGLATSGVTPSNFGASCLKVLAERNR
jgi:hypothetical protein